MISPEERQERLDIVLDWMRRRPHSTISYISAVTGLGRHQVYLVVSEMKYANKLRYNRSKRPGRWEILGEMLYT
jgi:hypothetical protein